MKILVLLILAAPVHAADIYCPDRWSPVGWITQGSAPGARVRSAGVMVGPIDHRGELRGREHKKNNGYDVHFAGLSDYAEPLSKWAYCSYGNDAKLLRQLPDTTTECVVKLRPAGASLLCR
jgi:hypothetical protein